MRLGKELILRKTKARDKLKKASAQLNRVQASGRTRKCCKIWKEYAKRRSNLDAVEIIDEERGSCRGRGILVNNRFQNWGDHIVNIPNTKNKWRETRGTQTTESNTN